MGTRRVSAGGSSALWAERRTPTLTSASSSLFCFFALGGFVGLLAPSPRVGLFCLGAITAGGYGRPGGRWEQRLVLDQPWTGWDGKVEKKRGRVRGHSGVQQASSR